VPNDRVHAVVEAFDVHANDAVEILLGGALNRSDVRDAGVVDQNLHSVATKQFFKCSLYRFLVRYIANVSGRGAASRGDLQARLGRARLVYVQYANHCAVRRELQSNGPPDTTAAAGDHSYFAV
jgi:hypothetical protein